MDNVTEIFFETYAKWYRHKEAEHQIIIARLFANKRIILSNIKKQVIKWGQ